MRLIKNPQFFLLQVIDNHLLTYGTPANLSYFWNFGFLAAICLIIQIVSGILLAMHYTPHIDLAFVSVEHIMRDVNNGWLLRYTHANGASFFFIAVYTHMFRGLYYGSYVTPREFVWIIGVVILILMMATGFMGYVLPWGQMSFWGATVITNLFSAIPVVGETVVYWLWGGFSVDNATLNRFFSLHYLMPFAIAGAVLLHITALHIDGSNNPVGCASTRDKIPFYPYFYIKDLFGCVVFIFIFSMFVFYAPNSLGHPDNYIPANPMVTPPHIVPEWYFLPFYAILRSIPDKLGGVVAMGAALVVLIFLPFIHTAKIRSTAYRPIHKFFFWLFVADCLLLGWIGGCVAESPYIEIGQLGTVFYFGYLLVLIPGIGLLENSFRATA
jgi:quinol-cytochrome oxidoreductase complex cytochrome b subunit